MFLAEVIGTVVSTKKDETMRGKKLLILRPLLVDEADPSRFRKGVNTIVAVDTMGAGKGEYVLFCQGSSARQGAGMRSLPIDAAVVGIVDSVEVLGERIYSAHQGDHSGQ